MTYLNELRRKLPVLATNAKTKRASAIKLFCFDCVGGRTAEVRKCTSTDCPLYPFRPGRK